MVSEEERIERTAKLEQIQHLFEELGSKPVPNRRVKSPIGRYGFNFCLCGYLVRALFNWKIGTVSFDTHPAPEEAVGHWRLEKIASFSTSNFSKKEAEEVFLILYNKGSNQ